MTEGLTRYQASLDKLTKECVKEYLIRDPEYGDSWLEQEADDLIGTVKGEIRRFSSKMSRSVLKHRIIDAIAYLAMLNDAIEREEESS